MRCTGYSAGIRFNDCFFSEPMRLSDWTPPRCAGLFAILVADRNWAPKPFEALYFGEFGNNAPPGAAIADCAGLIAEAWNSMLLVSVLPLPFSTTAQRLALRSELAGAYHPAWGRAAASAQASATIEVPEEPRRRIGFLPFAEPTA